MATIVLNGKSRDIDDGITLGALLAASEYAQRRIAVEINREIVPKSLHAQRVLRDGDRVEIVQAMGGG
jgi:sulfur carrier protein